ncbi:MAG: hypothetical protein RE471_05360 [Ferroplasma sp.]|uniref:hypothetical protein n=1 Tax=Ferroplasma sp. TaxID=2591003 RepID=UPI002815D41C|nr:hypothetical protein [Ferroplasma sp.]WMT50411.1 MAG: hypothetical protein RE471_05360 [Ferroplasma sp.]
MAAVKPYSDEDSYLAHEFLMKDPYKNTIISAVLEESGRNSLLIYDNGVIRGILAVTPDYRNLWFYGNRASFRTAADSIGYTEFNLYIDPKNLDIAMNRFNFSKSRILIMRLKIRDYTGNSKPARKIEEKDMLSYGDSFGSVPEYLITLVEYRNRTMVAAGGIASINSKSCALDSIKWVEGNEDAISSIISGAISLYGSQTENIVIYLDYSEKMKTILESLGFIFTGEIIKLHKNI